MMQNTPLPKPPDPDGIYEALDPPPPKTLEQVGVDVPPSLY